MSKAKNRLLRQREGMLAYQRDPNFRAGVEASGVPSALDDFDRDMQTKLAEIDAKLSGQAVECSWCEGDLAPGELCACNAPVSA